MRLLALLGALAIAGGFAWAEDTDKCPGKKKDCEKKDDSALLADCGKCKKDGECDKDKKEGEKKEGALLAGKDKDDGECDKDKDRSEERGGGDEGR